MGVNDMHAVHMGAKIVHVYVQLYLLVWIGTRSISITIEKKKSWASQDTKNAAKGAGMTGTRMIQFSAVYGWCHLWIGGKSLTLKQCYGTQSRSR